MTLLLIRVHCTDIAKIRLYSRHMMLAIHECINEVAHIAVTVLCGIRLYNQMYQQIALSLSPMILQPSILD